MRARTGSLTSCVGASALLHGALTLLTPRVPEARHHAPQACELRLEVLAPAVTLRPSESAAAQVASPGPGAPTRRRRTTRAPRTAPAEPTVSEAATSVPLDAPSQGGGTGAPAHGERGSAGPQLGWSAPVPLASNVPPHYPRIARASGVEGEVIVRLLVLADGTVGDVQIVQGLELFQEEVARTVGKWQYRPATRDGVPVASAWVVRVPFSLH